MSLNITASCFLQHSKDDLTGNTIIVTLQNYVYHNSESFCWLLTFIFLNSFRGGTSIYMIQDVITKLLSNPY